MTASVSLGLALSLAQLLDLLPSASCFAPRLRGRSHAQPHRHCRHRSRSQRTACRKRHRGRHRPDHAPRSARTDDQGRFSFDQLPEGRYDLTASAPGLIGEARGVRVDDGAPGQVDITLRVSAITETLVVSASQIDQPLSRVADASRSSTATRSPRDSSRRLARRSARCPGLTVARNGGPGTLTSVFPRGGESDFTLVLVDGIRANAFGGGIDLSQVPLGDVERIEVVRGPQSALYGSDAIGGVVQIITRQGGAPVGDGAVEGGSRATRRIAASTTGELGGWQWQVGGDYFADDGFTGRAGQRRARVQR